MKKIHGVLGIAQTTSFRLVGRALFIVPIAGLLMAPTCEQNHSGNHGDTSNPVVKYRAFGDSIPSGNLNSSSSHDEDVNYVNYYAQTAAAANGWRVTYQAKTTAGETTGQINSTMNGHLALVQEADILTFNGGGNDLLDARDDYGCNDSSMASAMNNWRANWNNLISTVENNVSADAVVRTMTIYYPDPDKDRSSSCSGSWNRFEILLPHGLAASDYMCSTAKARGWGCADALSVMNCDEDASGNADPDCPNIQYLEDLAQGACPRGSNGMMDYNCIRHHLDATGDWDYFRDPSSVAKGAATFNLVQGGDIHPNAEGHQRIAAAHHNLGYDLSEPECGDGTCNCSEGCGSCAADCGACPDCGDGICNGSEDTAGCPGDCGSSCGDGACNGSEGSTTCPSDCGASCGDGVCNGSEDCSSCGSDCGECPAGIHESGLSGGSLYYTLEVPADGDEVTISISGGSGDCDLHVKKNAAVSTSSYDCRPYKSGNTESCTFTGAGTYYILLNAYSSYAGMSLDADYTTGGGGSGGVCTNTCNYASDGECDDGGPGSDYSVCGLGTDCDDCGPR